MQNGDGLIWNVCKNDVLQARANEKKDLQKSFLNALITEIYLQVSKYKIIYLKTSQKVYILTAKLVSQN